MTKNEQIAVSYRETKGRRKDQVCKVFELKVDESHLSKKTAEELRRVFFEAKWFWNHTLSQGNILNFDTRITTVQVKTPDGVEDRKLEVLGSQVKQGLYSKMLDACRVLKKLREKGFKTGKLKFKRSVSTIPLKQFGITYKIKGNRIHIQGTLAWMRVSGVEQIPKGAEFADARLMKKPTGYYLKVTVWISKPVVVETRRAIGVDLGIKHQMNLSNGIELNFRVPIPKQIRKLQKSMSRSYLMNGKKHTKNWEKLRRKLTVAYEKERRKKDDIRNKICSKLFKEFDYVALQEDSIKSWQAGRYGKGLTPYDGFSSQRSKQSENGDRP